MLCAATSALEAADEAIILSAEEREGPGGVFMRAEQHFLEQEKLVKDLMAAAKDESLRGPLRQHAVMLLARMRTEEGRRFMLLNLSMRVVGKAGSDAEQARRQPCRYYLTTHGYRDASTVYTMLRMLDEEIPETEFKYWPQVLRIIFTMHPEMPRVLLERELRQAMTEPRKSRLAFLLGHL